MIRKIERWIDKKIPTKITITLDDQDRYGYRYKRHYPGGDAIDILSMLCFATAKEMQYAVHRADDKKEMLKKISEDFEQGLYKLACDMCDAQYIYKQYRSTMEDDDAEDIFDGEPDEGSGSDSDNTER